MTGIYLDSKMSDDERRECLYRGDIFVFSTNPAIQRLRDFAWSMIAESFAPHDPLTIDRFRTVEECAATLTALKPAFIHHPECKRLVPDVIESLGGDPEKVYFDVPRMRSAYPQDYLTSGIAYAFHPHRDTWYSAPMCQLNWWLPLHDLLPDNGLAFHPKYFGQPVANNSEIYNYYEWNKSSRAQAAKHIHSDTREQPKPQEPIVREEIKLVLPDAALILFAGAQLHETVPNTTRFARYSVDFRTVHIDDVADHHGAVNVDSRCTGTTMRDYLRSTDLRPLPAELVASYDDGTEIAQEMLVYAASPHR
jgi:hypothetical protein